MGFTSQSTEVLVSLFNSAVKEKQGITYGREMVKTVRV